MGRFYIVTGEKSGDLLGSFIGKELISRGHEVAGWGGKDMLDANITVDQDISVLKIMGWSDVLLKLPKIASLLNQVKNQITQYNPDTLILIDFGGFNLRLAKWAKKKGFRVVYYCPPKLWASRPGRIKYLKSYCDEIIVLFPFEQTYYSHRGLNTHYHGHPIAQKIRQFTPDDHFHRRYDLSQKPIFSILPGSRRSEINSTLPIYLEATKTLGDFQICISSAPGLEKLINHLTTTKLHVTKIGPEDYYNLLYYSDHAIITSGTATLEAGLFRLPHMIGYKTSGLNYWIARKLIQTDFIGLPNLITNQKIVPELIQNDLTAENIRKNFILQCQPSAKSKLDLSFNGIINELYINDCLFQTVSTITGEKK